MVLFTPEELAQLVRNLPNVSTPKDYSLPTSFPDLTQEPWIGIDLETHDPTIQTYGSGARRGGYIVGFSIKTPGFEEYYPLRHTLGPNVDPQAAMSWLNATLRYFRGEIIGANLLYDGDFLQMAGVQSTSATWRDVQIAEPLLNEHALSYSLEALAKKYQKPGKDQTLTQLYGPDVMSNFREVHPAYARAYGLRDVQLPIEILALQKTQLAASPGKLWEVFELESRLIPLLLYMRKKGVRVGLEQAEKVNHILATKRDDALLKLQQIAGREIDPDSWQSLARACDHLGLQYSFTEKGHPSFSKEVIKNRPEEFFKTLLLARKYEKARNPFITNYILGSHINGRIHAEFHPLRRVTEEGDSAGTITGRFSSSNPNLQNIPAHNEEIGPLLRSLFIPEQGFNWYSSDYSQIEYRLLCHYAALQKCPGAEYAQKLYRENPDIDFHQMVADLTKIPRKDAKNLNFGLCVHPETLLLTSDLRWIKALNVKLNDKLIGFDEYPNMNERRRRFRESTVENVEIHRLPCMKIITDCGEIICSSDHFWLVRYLQHKKRQTQLTEKITYQWTSAKDLKIGQVIPRLSKPWVPEQSLDSGWLAGIFDGEGWLSTKRLPGNYNYTCGVTQNQGVVWDRIKELLVKFGFKFSTYTTPNSKCMRLHLLGGRDEVLRFLGIIRPLRLLEKSKGVWLDTSCWSSTSKVATILSIEPVGVQDVVSIRTSTHTFIAEGLLSHNCYGMGVEKLSNTLGVDKAAAEKIMQKYHRKAPFIKALFKIASKRAESRGFIMTILGRLGRFPKVPGEQEYTDTHKALNKLLQGSAADLIKVAMVKAWDEGLFKSDCLTLGLTVHDELDGSVAPSEAGQKSLKRLEEIMETAIQLQVPILVNTGVGENWAVAKGKS